MNQQRVSLFICKALFFSLFYCLAMNHAWGNHLMPDSNKINIEQLMDASFTLSTTDDLISTQTQIDYDNNRSERLNKARAAVGKALDLGRFIQRLDSLAWIEFPVVLADTISNVPIAIVFDDLRLYPDYAQLEVIVKMKLPQRTVSATVGELEQNGQIDPDDPPPSEYVELFFGTPDLKFSHDGGIIGESLLGLYSDFPIGTTDPSKFAFILKGWSEYSQGNNTQNLGTYVKINCDGFVEMGVEADVFFSRDWIVPVDQNDEPLATGRVKGHIQTVVTDWQNLLVEIDLPNFAPATYTDIAFNLSTAVFDFSDYRNSPNVIFPSAYADQHLMPGNPNLWRGVYINNLELSLPKQIKNKNCVASIGAINQENGTDRIDAFGTMILDDSGAYTYGVETELRHSNSTSVDEKRFLESSGSLDHIIEAPPLWESPAVENSCRTKVGVSHLLIDGHGVSGQFYAEEVLSLDQGNMSGWKFSLADLAVDLVCSEVVGFGFGGAIGLPILKRNQSFDYNVFVNIPDRSYNFNITIGQDYKFPVFKMADVAILEGSYLDVVSTPDDFEPSAVLYGYAAVKAKKNSSSEDGDDSEEAPEDLDFSAPKLNFEGLRLATRGTKMSLITGGSISLEMGLKLMGFELPVVEPKLTAMPNGKMKLSFDITLNLMNQADNGFGAETGVDIEGELEGAASENEGQSQETSHTEHQWRNTGMGIRSIAVDINMSSLKIYGYAHVFDDHPQFGNGFQGSLSVDIGPTDNGQDPTFQLELNAIFGQTDFKYWYVDGFVEVDRWGVPLIPTVVEMNGFGGGAYYHMKMDGMDLLGGSDGSAGTLTSGVRYIPHKPTTLGLKATLAIRSIGTETLDGVVTLELRFEDTGLQEIMFYGRAEIVSPSIDQVAGGFSNQLQDRISKLNLPKAQMDSEDAAATGNPVGSILASFFLRMNFEVGFEFQGTFRAKLDAAEGVVKGEGGIDFLISAPQDRWHLYIGGYSDNTIMASDGDVLPPISVTIELGDGMYASAYAYFLMGNDIPGPPPLSPFVAEALGISTQSNNRGGLGEQAALGTGFAFGAGITAQLEGRTRKNGKYHNNYWRAELGAGFDVSLLKYNRNTYCSLSGQSPHGHKGWRATGRIWAYASVNGKYRGAPFNIGAGLLIEADLPKPTYLLVFVSIHIIIDIEIEAEIGDKCGQPYNN